MDYPIEHEDFTDRNLAIRIDGLFSSAKLVEGSAPVPGSRNKFTLRDNHGQERKIQLRVNGLDPLPIVEIDGEKIRLDRALAWFEYVWIGLPVVLVFAGGALGALFGVSATFFSARVFRSDRSTAARYALSAFASVAAVVGYFIGVVAFQYAIAAFQDPASKAALVNVADATNRDLPVMVDDQTEFYEAEGLDGILVFRYRLPSVTSGDVDPSEFSTRMSPMIRSNLCADSELRSKFLDEGVVLRLSYSTSERTELATIDVRSDDCE